jgi:hypothetical protein
MASAEGDGDADALLVSTGGERHEQAPTRQTNAMKRTLDSLAPSARPYVAPDPSIRAAGYGPEGTLSAKVR